MGLLRRFPPLAPTLAFTLLTALAAAPRLAAQDGEILGRVVDEETGAGLANVNLQALDAGGSLEASVLTGSEGNFRLSLSPGSYTLVASLIGYDTRRVEGIAVRTGAEERVTIALRSRALLLNPLVISASRREEKAVAAPASVSVVDEESVRERPTVTPTDHLRGVPGMDVATYGLQSSTAVARGFNNVFSGSLHTLTDHRIASVPSLRVNFLHFIPSTDEDIERMEVVLGPGSALYGPNTAEGVLHILTKSPLDEEETVVSAALGERSAFQGTFRTSQRVGDGLGIKVSGQYVRGDDWEFEDPAEVAERNIADSDPDAWMARVQQAADLAPEKAQERFDRIAARDFRIERYSGEVRADWEPAPDTRAVLSLGTMNQARGVELTGLGGGQARNWRQHYAQVRFTRDRLFAQAYLNASSAGKTFLLRDGTPISDDSRLLVTQLQHGTDLGERQSFIYGLDFLRTMPETGGTIHGQHEGDNDFNEFGAYLQSETELRPGLNLVAAARIDTHSALPDPVFSPRAGLVYEPQEGQAFRATFNRAFSTPTANNLFLDLGAPVPEANLSRLGYSLRVQGTSAEGIRLRGPNGSVLMRSPFTPAGMGGPQQLIPTSPSLMWQMAVGVLQAQGALTPEAAQILLAETPDDGALGLQALDLATGRTSPFDPAAVEDVPPVRESNTTTFEVGYTGVLADRLRLSADVWYSRKDDFVSPLLVQTPLLLLDPQDAGAHAVPRLVPHFMEQGMSQEQAQEAAGQVVEAMARLPLGVVSSEEVNATGPQLLMSYRNFGDISLWGTDLAASLLLTDRWTLDLTASLVSDDWFLSEGQPIALNAPERKGSAALRYRNRTLGFNAESRVRHTAGFPVLSGVYVGTECVEDDPGPFAEPCVDSHTLVDVTAGYRVPRVPGLSVQLSVQNLLDTEYRSFAGVPEVGRMALLRLRYAF